jgi:PHD/YefM family antitoxin component YafN of YafNO toxin-antitoxin module
MNINYITDSYGKQSAVIIPIDDWKLMNDKLIKIENKLKILTGLKDAIEEVHQAREGKIELQSFKDFLDEN